MESSGAGPATDEGERERERERESERMNGRNLSFDCKPIGTGLVWGTSALRTKRLQDAIQTFKPG
jgi:hypothetical protein